MLTTLLKSSKLWFFLGVAAVAILVVFLFRALTLKPLTNGTGVVIPPKLEEALQKAKEEVLIAKTEAKIKADTERAELEVVLKIDDGVERRKKLAELLVKLPKKK